MCRETKAYNVRSEIDDDHRDGAHWHRAVEDNEHHNSADFRYVTRNAVGDALLQIIEYQASCTSNGSK